MKTHTHREHDDVDDDDDDDDDDGGNIFLNADFCCGIGGQFGFPYSGRQ